MDNDLSTSNGSLKDILNSEYYLEKILRHLVDDGLYECRLVCRKWYDVCSRLPVKLADVPVTKLPVVVNRFPNAVALSFPLVECKHETAATVQSLARMKSLEAITVDGMPPDMTNSAFLLFCSSLGEALQSCHELRAIIILPRIGVEAGLCLYSHLSHLTSLTRLHLPGGWEQLVSDPYTDFRNIEDLKIDSVCLESGQLVFPSLTHLTRLEMRADLEPAKKFRGGALEMILPYASSLQSLRICGSYSWVNENTEWALLREFGQVSSVEFECLAFDEAFCVTLNCLNLTHLGFKYCQFSADFMERIADVKSLTSLRSLHISSLPGDVRRMFAAMPQLTSLCMPCMISMIDPLTVLTALRDLQFRLDGEAQSDLPHVFSHMPNLESLNITLADCSGFSSTWFSLLKKLSSLSLEDFSLDGDIFRTLAQLSGLTKLVLYEGYGHMPSGQWSGINALTNLESLELEFWEVDQTVDQMSALTEGKLLKLRHLKMCFADEDPCNQWQSLHQRLPSLRQCFILEPHFSHIVYPEEFKWRSASGEL